MSQFRWREQSFYSNIGRLSPSCSQILDNCLGQTPHHPVHFMRREIVIMITALLVLVLTLTALHINRCFPPKLMMKWSRAAWALLYSCSCRIGQCKYQTGEVEMSWLSPGSLLSLASLVTCHTTLVYCPALHWSHIWTTCLSTIILTLLQKYLDKGKTMFYKAWEPLV